MIGVLRQTFVVIAVFAFATCGQDEVKFPDDTGTSGVCGAWYPGGDLDAGVEAGGSGGYAVEEGAIFPCAVWESARLAGQDTFIDVGHMFLEIKHGVATTESLVIIVGAEHCPSCNTLISAMAERAGDFTAAGAFPIGMARRDLQGGADDPDFDLDYAYDVLAAEGWPVDIWHAINDEEDYLPLTVDTAPPWVIIVRTSDMEVQVASNFDFQPDADGVAAMLDFLSGPTFD